MPLKLGAYMYLYSLAVSTGEIRDMLREGDYMYISRWRRQDLPDPVSSCPEKI